MRGNRPMFRPLLPRSKRTLIGDASKIYRVGTNEDLADAKSYWEFGGDLSLRARLDVGSPVQISC